MNDRTALHQSMALDRDRMAARQTADQICHLLRHFIPEACFHDAIECVRDAAYRSGMEFTTKAQRKEYEAAKATLLDLAMLTRSEPLQNNR